MPCGKEKKINKSLRQEAGPGIDLRRLASGESSSAFRGGAIALKNLMLNFILSPLPFL